LYVSGAAIEVSINHNEFAYTGDTAILFAGRRFQSSGSSLLFSQSCHITDNHIHDQGYYEKHAVGIFVGTSDRTTISNNRVHDVPRACINLNDPFYGGHIIEFNRLYNCMKESADCGPLNSFGRTRFWSLVENHEWDYQIQGVPHRFPAGPVYLDALRTTIVRNNYISFVAFPGTPHATWVQNIDMDDGSSNFAVYENVCEGASIKIGAYGDLHSVQNNIVVDTNRAMFLWNPMLDNTDILRTNILYYSYPVQTFVLYEFGGASGIDVRGTDYNLFYAPGATKYEVNYFSNPNMNISEWQKKGFDTHSIFGQDPGFTNPKAGNYTLKLGSPALALGFQNFQYGNQFPVGRSADMIKY